MELVNLLHSIEIKPYQFPREAFDILYKNGYMQLPRDRESFKKQSSKDETSIILRDLIEIGYVDLAVGRIYEGHINALLIIDKFGTDNQKAKYFQDAKDGMIFGIWNTELPFEAMTFEKSNEGYKLNGAKTFCSGSLDIDRPIITANNDAGKQMIVLEMENHQQLEEDQSLWDVVGMESSVSYRIDFSNIIVTEEQLIGKADDYDGKPMLYVGAIRFVAVQFGAAKAIADITIKHLNKTNRANHPMQNARIANLGILIKAGQLWMDAYDDKIQDDETHINYVNMARTEMLRICDSVLSLGEKAIGVQGFAKPHPFEQKYRDLKVYLRQPNPDLAVESIGKYYTENDLDS